MLKNIVEADLAGGRPRKIGTIDGSAAVALHIKLTPPQHNSLRRLVELGDATSVSEIVRQFIDTGLLSAELRHGGLTPVPRAGSGDAGIVDCQTYCKEMISHLKGSTFVCARVQEIWQVLQDARMCPEFRRENLLLAGKLVDNLELLTCEHTDSTRLRVKTLLGKIFEAINGSKNPDDE